MATYQVNLSEKDPNSEEQKDKLIAKIFVEANTMIDAIGEAKKAKFPEDCNMWEKVTCVEAKLTQK